MKLKRVLALLMTLVFVVSMAACGNSEGSKSTNAPAETKATDAKATQAADDATEAGDETQAPADDADDEDLAEIEVMFWTLNTIPTDLQTVEDAINEITEAKINTTVHLNIIEMGNYIQQVNLMMSSNEKLDLMVTLPGGPAHFNSMSSQKQLMDITDLLNEYGQDLLKVVPESWLAGTTINGKIYSVTSYGDKATPLNFACRTDYLEETGIDPATIKTATDLEALFAKVHELHPEITVVGTGSKKILTLPYMIDKDGNFVKFDGLGDGDNALIGIMDGDGTTIQNNYLREIFTDTSLRFKDWYEKGWVYKDGASYDETAEALVSAGSAFGYFKQFAMDSQATCSATCGQDMTLILLEDDPMLGTGAFRKFSWAVPTTATEPEAAVKFMNLLYTDAEVLNLLTWGVEGVHYQTLEDGSIDFLDGQDASTCGYYLGDETSIFGNGFLAKVRKGQAPDLRSRCEEANLSANVSKFNGFSFNSEGFENQVAGITNTIEEYRPTFANGLYTEAYYNEFIQKLKDNGVEEYLAYIQQQLDDWLKANPIAE